MVPRSLIACLLLVACGGDDAPPSSLPDAAVADGDVGQPAQLISNLKLGDYPHPIDVYLPAHPVRAVVFLHGGGGSKEGGAQRELGIATAPVAPATTPTPDTSWLDTHGTVFILPQGQAVPGADRAPTWSNYVMTSGVDDVAFLDDLAAALRAGKLDARIPALAHVHLAGHSNGGMMANRMWCERPTTFDAYGSLAGPSSVQLARGRSNADPLFGAHPCAPAIAKPYLGIVGDADTIIQTAGAWDANTWSINSCLQSGTGDAFVDPALLNELFVHRTVRALTRCNATVASEPTTSGNLTTWSDCEGSIQLVRVAGAEHCVLEGQMPCMDNKLLGGNCAISLEARAATPIRDRLLDFFAKSE